MLEECPVLGWAASGGMALTGDADGAPVASPAPAFGLLSSVVSELASVTRSVGAEVRADPGELMAGRAALAGFLRRGRVSAGGSARLLRAADGWCAVNLSRGDDVAAVPAIVGGLGLGLGLGFAGRGLGGDLGRDLGGFGGGDGGADTAWGLLEAAAVGVRAEALAGAAQGLGVPAAALPGAAAGAGPGPGRIERIALASGPRQRPGRVERIALASGGARLAGAVVVDLSSMWAGPLCARLLGLAGAEVIKVETPGRPDGARAGERRFFDWLHGGHRSVVLDFRAESGRRALGALIAAADVVIEASRPRALGQLGLAPEMLPHRDGQVWLSITGYGRGGDAAGLVAFGDDAAVAGGLVGWTGGGEPVFCADAIADPLTGVCGALAVARSVADGGGQLIDLSMRAVAAWFAGAAGVDHGPHSVRSVRSAGVGGVDALVTCAALGMSQEVRAPAFSGGGGGGAAAAAMGADTSAVLARLGLGSSGC
ncbi:MAG TPA: CoA transferase [Trebonia sp.]|nr:CoA transferase [Trebonia sp.]